MREHLHAGVDAIKVVIDDWPKVIAGGTLKETVVDEAHRVGAGVAAHGITTVGIQTAIDAGVDSTEHGDGATDHQFAAMEAKRISRWPRAPTSTSWSTTSSPASARSWRSDDGPASAPVRPGQLDRPGEKSRGGTTKTLLIAISAVGVTVPDGPAPPP